MKVSDVMTRRVISVRPEAGIRDAVQLMLKNKISGLPVIDGKRKLVGIVSEGDFLRRGETGTDAQRSPWYDALFGSTEAARAYAHAYGRRVHDVMTGKPITVGENTSLREAVGLMEQHRVKRLPVLRGDKVIGILSRANLISALVKMHRAAPKSSKGDEAIRRRILLAVRKQTWSVGMLVEVVVRDGIVSLWGKVDDPEHRDALKILVEATPGVKRLEDHLSWTAVTSF